uniref:Uncharacterized protein n=1 Tax=Arundo donax TaxID=35708 RepID=A0A0A9BTG9_ARUDO
MHLAFQHLLLVERKNHGFFWKL